MNCIIIIIITLLVSRNQLHWNSSSSRMVCFQNAWILAKVSILWRVIDRIVRSLVDCLIVVNLSYWIATAVFMSEQYYLLGSLLIVRTGNEIELTYKKVLEKHGFLCISTYILVKITHEREQLPWIQCIICFPPKIMSKICILILESFHFLLCFLKKFSFWSKKIFFFISFHTKRL